MSNNDQPVLLAESTLATHAQHPERTEASGCTTARHSVKSDSAVPEDSHDELLSERMLATPSLIDPVCTTSKIVPTERETVGTASTNAIIVTIAGWMVGRWGRSPPHHLPHGWVTEWMTRIVTQYIASNVWRRVTTPLARFLSRWVRSTPSLLRRRTTAHRGREIVPAGVASALHHSARTLPPAGSSSWTPREEGLRVLAGSGEKTLSLPANLAHQVTRKVRARNLRSRECGTARIATERKLNTPHSPQLAPPASRPPRSINQRCIIRNGGFYLPTPTTNSHPK